MPAISCRISETLALTFSEIVQACKLALCKPTFLDEGSALRQLEGKIDVTYLGSVLHLFGWEGQLQAAKQIARLSKVGTMVLEYQIGAAVPDDFEPTWRGSKSMYGHSEGSFKQLWEEAVQETGISWAVESSLND